MNHFVGLLLASLTIAATAAHSEGSNCEVADTSRSSWVEGAQYCSGTLQLDLGAWVYTFNHVAENDWIRFSSAKSLGNAFNQVIKKKYHYSDKRPGIKGIHDLRLTP